MTQILAFSGKKQSGKSTSANFLFGMSLVGLDLVDHFTMSREGKLIVPSSGGSYMELDLASSPKTIIPEVVKYMSENVWPHIKVYNFADPLKEYCITVFGLSWEQCYGDDDAKNSLTPYLWENMPIKVKNKKGQMTARELLQYWGTEIMRSIDNDIWVKVTLRQIHAEAPAIALIGDVRFPNEVEGVQAVGGKVIRLTRNNDSKDNHKSETGLNPDKFDWQKFDTVLDNENVSIDEQCNNIMKLMQDWNIINNDMENVDGEFKEKVNNE